MISGACSELTSTCGCSETERVDSERRLRSERNAAHFRHQAGGRDPAQR